MWQWAKRRHPKKSSPWVYDKYYRIIDGRRWMFTYDTGAVFPDGNLPMTIEAVERRVALHAQDQRRREDLQLELARPFEHKRKLTELLVRQRELLKQLELDKDEVGTSRTDTDAGR